MACGRGKSTIVFLYIGIYINTNRDAILSL